MAYRPEVEVNGTWNKNALVFATREEAEASAFDLYSRWTLCTNGRAVEVDEPVNYRLVDGRLEAVEPVNQAGE